ncbi:MAG TPA: methyltransferase domain-containing protein [Polyangiaceae bacterium]|nr:methyltransferase domain-containing protein [Polyangiaceae bacterium]
MTHVTTSSALPVVPPRYQRSPKAHIYAANFPEASLSVECGRARCYPGLVGDAPDTRALYLVAAELLAGAQSVVDLGCGSGMGVAELSTRFKSVSAVDADAGAVAFVRQYLARAPHVAVVRASLGDGVEPAVRHDAGCVIDMLGHTANPVAALRGAHRWLSESGRLFLAEPRAYPNQALLPPVLRAFTRPGLTQLLLRSGWEVERWLDDLGNFVACVLVPSKEDGWLWLERGDRARQQGNAGAALEAYATAAQRGSAALGTEALLGCAAVHVERGELDAACRCLLDAAQTSAGHPRALAGLAEISLLTGDARQALALAVRALETDPCELSAVQAMAGAADRLEQPEAFASWRIANGLAPSDLASAIEASRLAAAHGELPYAIWVLERVRRFRSDLGADFHVTLAWLYAARERFGQARLEAELARVQEPDSAAVAELLAHLDSITSAS